MSNQKNKRLVVFLTVLVLALASLVTTAVVANRQLILDYVTILSNETPDETAVLVEKAGMNDKSKFFYLASQPRIESTQEFNNICRSNEKSSSVLGCYRDKRIYVYGVKDERLEGVMEVTAAHETLHAIYDRLSVNKRREVNHLLVSEYDRLKTDKALAKRLAVYADLDSDHLVNELHSILGTEVEYLSYDLENYYKQYFVDRSVVVGLYNSYSSVLEDINNKIEKLGAQLDELAGQIDDMSEQYNQMVENLNNKIRDFNNRASSGWFTSQSQFDAERSALSNEISQASSLRNQINSLVSRYNKVLDEYNLVASESKALYDSIDSTLAPAPAL